MGGMNIEDLDVRMNSVRNEVWDLAREFLERRDTKKYRILVDIAEKLTTLSPEQFVASSLNNEIAGQHEIVDIFVRFKGIRYEATLDVTRINGGRGRCVYYDNEWLTPSRAAHQITKTQVNGWLFWKFKDREGRDSSIHELREA